MAKARSIFTCAECGAASPKWQGQCPGCGQWNTLTETIAEATGAGSNRYASLAGSGQLQDLSVISPREESRQPTGIEEFDRVLGGGLVSGGVVL
ncbi:MAG: DNA repair protein RadA, partial [Burkholderiaceae bacterium]|nr:DNA repair protein RadA [Burkholderiaceae bacterium]